MMNSREYADLLKRITPQLEKLVMQWAAKQYPAEPPINDWTAYALVKPICERFAAELVFLDSGAEAISAALHEVLSIQTKETTP